MLTSLSLAYLGTQQSDVQLFDASDLSGEGPGASTGQEAPGALEEVGLEEVQLEEVEPAPDDDAGTP